MNPTLKIATFLIFFSIVVFYISNTFFGGYLSFTHNKIDTEVGAPADALYEWNLAEKAPFKYRVLFPAIVKGSWLLIDPDQQDNASFILVYQSWSLLFLISSVLAFFFLLKSLGFNEMWSLAGTLLFMMCPPVLLAYTLPVHTREDTLGYTLVCMGLLCLFEKRIFLFLLISVISVFCRETMLILPFVFVFFLPYKNFWYRAFLAVIPVAVWISLRLILGDGGYDMWEGFRWNIHNPAQVIGFSFITFHFLWGLFFYGIYRKPDLIRKRATLAMQFMYHSATAVFTLVILTTFLGGIFNEIRLLFLLSPWIIGISLHVLFIHREVFITVIKKSGFYYYAALNVLLFGGASIYFVQNYERFMEGSKFDISFDVWIIATLFYSLAALLFLPVYLKLFSHSKSLINQYANHC